MPKSSPEEIERMRLRRASRKLERDEDRWIVDLKKMDPEMSKLEVEFFEFYAQRPKDDEGKS